MIATSWFSSLVCLRSCLPPLPPVSISHQDAKEGEGEDEHRPTKPGNCRVFDATRPSINLNSPPSRCRSSSPSLHAENGRIRGRGEGGAGVLYFICFFTITS